MAVVNKVCLLPKTVFIVYYKLSTKFLHWQGFAATQIHKTRLETLHKSYRCEKKKNIFIFADADYTLTFTHRKRWQGDQYAY